MAATRKIALIAGTSNNLGMNIAYRLIEQIPSEVRLTIIVTSRTIPKVKECIKQIQKFNESLGEGKKNVDFDYLMLDFTNMLSVLTAYYDLSKQYSHIDYLYLCSGLGVYDGIDWFGATKEILANPIEGVTQPHYKIQRVGVKTADGMGLVFQLNVFGPYYLIHKLKPLLRAKQGKIVWISSLMSKPSYLSFEDLQLVQSKESYEGSKRLIDLLHLATYKKLQEEGIEQYLTQPGIFESLSFHQFLNVFTVYGMLLMFYVARWLGSPWHNVTGYNALELSMHVTFACHADPLVKHGSATDKRGRRYVLSEEVDGTGAEDVGAYLEALRAQWDAALEGQIVNTREV